MNSFRTLFRLELKARFGTKGQKPLLKVVRTGLLLVFVALVYMLYIFGAKQIIEMFHLYDISSEFLILFIGIAQLILAVFGISSVINTLYHSGDNELLLRFPVSGSAIFLAKITMLVVYQVIFTVAVMLPVFIIFGLETNQAWTYYALMPLVMLICVALPLGISNLFAIPAMHLSSQTKHMFTLSLLVSVIFVAAGFALYMNVVQGVVDYMKEEAMSFFSKESIAIVSKAVKYIIPSNFIAYMMIGENMVFNSLMSIFSVCVVIAAALLVIRKFYMGTVLKNIEVEGTSFTKPTVNKVRTPAMAVFKREFTEIFRSSNYSFQYLCMAVAAPVMVFYCNKLAAVMGENTIGSVIVPALTMMVMLIFVSIILSFAASSVSREGENFYLTKISPVSFRMQVMVKLGLYMLVSTISSLITAVVVWLTGQVELWAAASAFGISFMISVAITCFAVRLDTSKPQFAVGGDGELSVGNISTFITLFIGFLISVLYGLFGMVGIFLWGETMTFAILGGVSGVLMIAAVLWLMIGLEKRYSRISQR